MLMMMLPFSDISIADDFGSNKCAYAFLQDKLEEILPCVNLERNMQYTTAGKRS